MNIDLCTLLRQMRTHYFAKDRDIYIQTSRKLFLGDGTEVPSSALIPVGGIIIWSGAVGAIPSGYQICDGTNGTPDLRDRFVIGAGSSYAVDATGGSTTKDISHTHGAGTYATDSDNHTHGAGTYATDSDVHTHAVGTYTIDWYEHQHSFSDTTSTPSATNAGDAGTGTADATAGHTHTVSALTGLNSHDHDLTGSSDSDSHSHDVTGTSASDSHSHDVTGTSGTGGSAVQDIMPPYYALAYIQRLS